MSVLKKVLIGVFMVSMVVPASGCIIVSSRRHRVHRRGPRHSPVRRGRRPHRRVELNRPSNQSSSQVG